ncbi:MAG: UxaA family hydrolase [Deinococcota bacterium]
MSVSENNESDTSRARPSSPRQQTDDQFVDLDSVARLSDDASNVAIALSKLAAGTRVKHQDDVFSLSHTVLTGHRFAVKDIAVGETLTSWGLPFGRASRAISAGDYVCNASTLEALSLRDVDADFPQDANFEDDMHTYTLDFTSFEPADQIPRHDLTAMFEGYARRDADGNLVRGVGTRNMIVLLGTSSRTASFVRQLERRLNEAYNLPDGRLEGGLEGIVAVAHTEGGSRETPNNLEQTLRTLAGFMTHANVAACLAVDMPSDALNNERLKNYLSTHDYPLETLPHAFMSLQDSFNASLERAEQIITGWLPIVRAQRREPMPLHHLKVALQCGGSDAFSGISGNPLAAWVAKEIIQHGGSANLAETDELIGAESYVLQHVKDISTAQQFLDMVARYKQFAASHGTSAEGNPSGGNKFRGLYNIVLKSIGAANKKHPDVRLDAVINYGQPMTEPGFYFMDSPGNDLESIAGQVAAGCNLIFFITGNGSITNFPFVPTIKIVTTSTRFELLKDDMDVNAGEYLDGTPLDEVGRDTFNLSLQVASGERSVGERAGHSQVQLWRNWQQPRDQTPDKVKLEHLKARERRQDGVPIPIRQPDTTWTPTFTMTHADDRPMVEPLGLLLPTSLCSGQVARMAAERLNQQLTETSPVYRPVHRFVPLVHTEGCGVSSGSSEALFARTFVGYLRHPAVRIALLLEHGCEKTQNDTMRHYLQDAGVDPNALGWASVQLDGGIGSVLSNIDTWATARLAELSAYDRQPTSLASLKLAFLTDDTPDDNVAHALAELTTQIVAAGGTIVLSDRDPIWQQAVFLNALGLAEVPTPNLAYGQYPDQAGLFVMMTPTSHWLETLTGLAATGVHTMLAHITDYPQQVHPLVPLVQVTTNPCNSNPDLDANLSDTHEDELANALLEVVLEVVSANYTPKLVTQGNTAMQMTRGLLGVSL